MTFRLTKFEMEEFRNLKYQGVSEEYIIDRINERKEFEQFKEDQGL